MAAAAAANLAGRPGVRVVVIGDPGTGKSSLVVAVATEQFPENVPKVMPHTRLPADYFPDRVPITIVDTSSRSAPPFPSALLLLLRFDLRTSRFRCGLIG
jgi:Ras family protein T1